MQITDRKTIQEVSSSREAPVSALILALLILIALLAVRHYGPGIIYLI